MTLASQLDNLAWFEDRKIETKTRNENEKSKKKMFPNCVKKKCILNCKKKSQKKNDPTLI